MACTQPSLSAPERFCSPEELGEESRWAEKQLVSPSSRQMLGTIRINGLEIQVRAIQKLPDYSKYRSLRRKRLIEAQNWKRSNPGSGGRASGERLLRGGGPGLPPKEELGLDNQLLARLAQRSRALASLSPHPS